jgi:hypothetical protein
MRDSTWWRRIAPWGAIAAASFAFRAPALLNASLTNSDAAVVGLQAMHVLRGEWSPFLWGSGYQTSVDSTWAALVFAALGATPLALMLSSLALHVVLTLLAYDVLRRRVSPALAILLVLPLIFTGTPSHTYILYPPRQAALTLAMASAWIFERGGDAPRAHVRFALGGALASLACFADPYALVLMPVIAVLALTTAWRGAIGPSAGRALAAVGGAIVGLLPALALWRSARASHGQTGLAPGVVAHNARLLWDECLPWALSAKVYFARHMMDYAPWDPPGWVRALQIAGAASLVVGIALGGALVFARRIPWPVRRLGLVGSLAFPVTIAGFLVSVMVMDHFSARYLAAFLLVTPFALAPVASLLGARRFAIAVAPFVITSAIGGWMGYAPFVRGPIPVRVASDDAALGAALAERGVRYAMADYWASYRLTFVLGERVIVVPTNGAEDRYAPYRAAFEATPVVAYVFDPLRSREAAGAMEARVRAGDTPFERDAERLDVGDCTVLVLRRRSDAPVTQRSGQRRLTAP